MKTRNPVVTTETTDRVWVDTWKVVWRDGPGFELEGWYVGSEQAARRFAREKMRKIGAVDFTIEHVPVREGLAP